MTKIAYVLALLRRLLHLNRRKAAHLPRRHSQLPRILLRIYLAAGVLLALVAVGTAGFYLIGKERAILRVDPAIAHLRASTQQGQHQ